MLKKISGLVWLWLTAVLLIIDQVSKNIITSSMSFDEVTNITKHFNISLVKNPGAAFSFLADGHIWQYWLLILFSIVVIVSFTIKLYKANFDDTYYNLGLCLVIAGALGNLFDRIRLGFVVDFLDLHVKNYHWPVFNIADIAICIGVAILFFAKEPLKN